MTKASPVAETDAALLKDPRQDLIQRVVSSQHFRASARLREFLLYVGECAIRAAPEAATEQQIGIHVFHRSPGYNSSEDSIVRTHARLLRNRLAEYFSGEGAQEELIIEIPKGHYLPVFRPAVSDFPSSHPLKSVPQYEETFHVPITPATHDVAHGRGKIWLSIAVLFLIALSTIVIFLRARTKPRAVESAMETLWTPFLSGSQPLVIYSNALFVRDSEDGFQVAPTGAAATPNQPLRESGTLLYTGTGAVMAIHQLTQLFDSHQAAFILKRSHLVTWDDARLTNLIFIGSRLQNPALTMLPSMHDFSLVEDSDSEGFTNLHPKPGEPVVYSRPKYFFGKDYAVLALLPGLQRGKWTLIFSGLSTLGTEAAVEYACRPEDVAGLLRAASFRPGEIRPFEALLETTIVGGVPMETKLITIRTH